jgi:bifunctional enzyme Fae/Hps
MLLVGEALIGEEPELAHVDLIIGDKNGPVGLAFANGLTQLSAGHTPLLSVIRPNLPAKPSTLIVPKVTVKNMALAAQIFGPAQAAVAKAVADAVEEGVISKKDVEDLVIVASVSYTLKQRTTTGSTGTTTALPSLLSRGLWKASQVWKL